ncbi:hypothetical protein D9756_002010 [Leucocoprinus leucothites]|uniref:Uncharacterized protein n=1 Tax=Leucocoprinus leucothites TaxID=201217 RepID=A0A8H5GBG4_9AGAR|nr:hypothetical protein D9756_011568 [Leucoagaricus leucothites]KAF5361937.1 hypothetical protein D9756_002010 [Leucoagaricus leucothites]
MLSIQVSRILIFALTFLPSLISAKRGGGGSGGGGSFGDGDSNFSLEPLDAATFAFIVIFAVITAIQALIALSNIRRRINKVPPSIATLEYSVGPIFPICLLMTTLLLTTSYGLYATYVGRTYNTSTFEDVWWSVSFMVAQNVIVFLADIFLASSILALLSYREKIVLNTPGWIRDVKAIADAILVVILLALSMGFVGLGAAYVTDLDPAEAEAETLNKLSMAYCSFLFVAAVDIAVTSTMLYVRARKSSQVNDHSIIRRCAFIISPLYMVYTLFLLIFQARAEQINIQGEEVVKQWDLASVIIGCITEAIVINACLGCGMPPLSKENKEVKEHVHSEKVIQAV